MPYSGSSGSSSYSNPSRISFTEKNKMGIQKRKFHPRRNNNIKMTPAVIEELSSFTSGQVLPCTIIKDTEHRLHCPGSLDCCECRVESGFSCLKNRIPVSPRERRNSNTTTSSNSSMNSEFLLRNEMSCHSHQSTNYTPIPSASDKVTFIKKNNVMEECDSGGLNCIKEDDSLCPNQTEQPSFWEKLECTTKIHRFIKRFSGRRSRFFWRRAFSWLPSVQWTRMTSFLYTLFVLMTTCLPNLPVSYACSSRSTPKPRPPSPTLRPNITIQTYTCPPEYDAHYCLNGATCFTVKIGESILYNCECAEGYMGQRCEFKDLDGSYLPSKQRAMLAEAGIRSGVAILVILVVILCFYVYVRSRRKVIKDRMRTDGGDVGVDATDGENNLRIERKPFDPHYYFYTNPSLSISQTIHSPSTLHHQSDTRSSRGQSYPDYPLQIQQRIEALPSLSEPLPLTSTTTSHLPSSSSKTIPTRSLLSSSIVASPAVQLSYHPTVHKKVDPPDLLPPGRTA